MVNIKIDHLESMMVTECNIMKHNLFLLILEGSLVDTNILGSVMHWLGGCKWNNKFDWAAACRSPKKEYLLLIHIPPC